jgi:hypothetical protein
LTQDEVAQAALQVVAGAETTVDIASPWVQPISINRIISPRQPCIRAVEVCVRVVYRLSDETDLRITDLGALEVLVAEESDWSSLRAVTRRSRCA